MTFSLGKIQCPRCKYAHKFGHKKREIRDGIFELYISCPKCYWESVLFCGSQQQIKDYYQLKKLKHQSRVDSSLKKVYIRKLRRFNEKADL